MPASGNERMVVYRLAVNGVPYASRSLKRKNCRDFHPLRHTLFKRPWKTSRRPLTASLQLPSIKLRSTACTAASCRTDSACPRVQGGVGAATVSVALLGAAEAPVTRAHRACRRRRTVHAFDRLLRGRGRRRHLEAFAQRRARRRARSARRRGAANCRSPLRSVSAHCICMSATCLRPPSRRPPDGARGRWTPGKRAPPPPPPPPPPPAVPALLLDAIAMTSSNGRRHRHPPSCRRACPAPARRRRATAACPLARSSRRTAGVRMRAAQGGWRRLTSLSRLRVLGSLLV